MRRYGLKIIPYLAFLIFSIELVINFNKSNVLNETIKDGASLTLVIPSGSKVKIDGLLVQVLGDDDGVCNGKPCKVLLVKTGESRSVRLQVKDVIIEEVWRFSVGLDGIKIQRPDDSFVTFEK